MGHKGGLAALRHLDDAMLLCDDIAPMRSFYVDVLGLDVQREIAGGMSSCGPVRRRWRFGPGVGRTTGPS